MQRSYSHTYLNSQITPQFSLPPSNIVLQGKLLKKLPDYNSAAWNGLALQDSPFNSNVKSERRWKEFEESKRTIDPSYRAEEIKSIISTTSQKSFGNLTEMINRGFSRETLGNLNKRVVVSGKNLSANATSLENICASQGISEAYKEVHTGNSAVDRRQKKPASDGARKNASSVFDSSEYEERRQVKMKPEHFSSIYELPGYFKHPEPAQKEGNPKVKFLRNTATSVEKGEGDGVVRNGPRQEIIPTAKGRGSVYDAVGQESDLNPYTRGKGKNYNAEDKLLRGTVEERDLVVSKKGRPDSARNMFTSSFTFA